MFSHFCSRIARFFTVSAVTLVFLLLFASPGARSAQDDFNPPPAQVARFTYGTDEVYLAEAGSEDWRTAQRNRPLTNGDRLRLGPAGRAELRMGSTAARLGAQGRLEVVDIGDEDLRLHLSNGVLHLRVRYLGEKESIRITTPNVTVMVQEAGEFRLQALPDHDATEITVRQGHAYVSSRSGDGPRRLKSGEWHRFSGHGLWQTGFGDAGDRDDFERWANERDRRQEGARSLKYVSPYMTGYEDLDDYGDWEVTSSYGPVWVPRHTPRQWAPYRQGHWTWVAPWGWTWIDEQPWGFAPFHYGRWAYSGRRWVWVPEPRHIRPVYAPALVGFSGIQVTSSGNGRQWSTSFSFTTGTSWFPLAPGEAYIPPYTNHTTYITQINRHYPSYPYSGHKHRDTQTGSGGSNVGKNNTPTHYTNQAIPHAITRWTETDHSQRIRHQSLAGREKFPHRDEQRSSEPRSALPLLNREAQESPRFGGRLPLSSDAIETKRGGSTRERQYSTNPRLQGMDREPQPRRESRSEGSALPDGSHHSARILPPSFSRQEPVESANERRIRDRNEQSDQSEREAAREREQNDRFRQRVPPSPPQTTPSSPVPLVQPRVRSETRPAVRPDIHPETRTEIRSETPTGREYRPPEFSRDQQRAQERDREKPRRSSSPEQDTRPHAPQNFRSNPFADRRDGLPRRDRPRDGRHEPVE